MEVYFIDNNINQRELDEIYLQILNDYEEYNTVSMIFKDNKRNIN